LSDSQPILSVRDVSKSFGAVQALNHVSFDVNPGQVVALAGDNGAGKSTIIKAISGVFHHDSGEILLGGEPINFATPHEARENGIETIYQDLALADNLSIGENIFLGREPKRKLFGLPADSRPQDDGRRRARHDGESRLPRHPSRRTGRRLLRRPAAGDRDRSRDLLERSPGDHGRADRRARRARAAPCAGAGQGAARRRARASSSSRTTCATSFEVADEIVVFRRGENAGARVPSGTTHDEIVKLMVGG
jgi:simple sugar transport system ATP-binding protein